MPFRFWFPVVLGVCISGMITSENGVGQTKAEGDAKLSVRLTRQIEVEPGTGRYHRIAQDANWDASRVAVIVCDVWDSHHCLNAVRRVGELAPRIDAFVRTMRARGATIIHAPSDCMPHYEQHPARQRAQAVKRSQDLPDDIARWCDRIDLEDGVPYPVDQSDGGEDDDLIEHAQWHASLQAAGRNPKTPWKQQTPAIGIDEEIDWISDSGNEIWNILSHRQIEHVMLCGVHTNMCVLGRPFGLRQLRAHGKHAVLVRDLTDTMYNPSRWPYVSHFSGTDRVIDYIERTVCETMTSDQILGGQPFRFSGDRRPHWAILIAEDEYKTEETVTRWATEHLARDFRVSLVYSDAKQPHRLPGIEAIDSADALMVSVRRRPLPAEDLDRIRRFVAQGKPVLGIRTASHAFCLRDQAPAPGLAQWFEFDAQVFGGNYTNHHPDGPLAQLFFAEGEHPLMAGSLKGREREDSKWFASRGSLYRVEPLKPGAQVLIRGEVEGAPSEPVAWTFVRADAGRSFYTSLGHASDFEQDAFGTLLLNAAYWLTDHPTRVTEPEVARQREAYREGRGKQR